MRAQGRRSFAIHTPATAYRKDIAGRENEPCDEQEHGGWIMVATLLHHATLLPPDETDSLVGHAVRMTSELLAPEIIERGCALDPPGTTDPGAAAALRLIAERMEDGACPELAAVTLECIECVVKLSELDVGRVRANRARIAWKLGHIDAAMNHYRAVDRMACGDKYPELQIRAWIGYLALAHLKGNYPEVRMWSERAADLADRKSYIRLGALAHQGLMMVAGQLGDYDQALVHGWAVYRASLDDPIARTSALQNLSQVLLESGHPEAARAGFAALLARKQRPGTALNAIGSLAVANAELGDREAVATLSRHIVSVPRTGAYRHALSLALCECAVALAIVGDDDESTRLRDMALEIAEADGFHEIRFRAAGITATAARPNVRDRRDLGRAAVAVADHVCDLAPSSTLHESLMAVLG